MKKLIIALLTLALCAAVYAGTYSISQNVVQSATTVTRMSDVRHVAGGDAYMFVIRTATAGDYARIWVPVHDAETAVLMYVADVGSTYDSCYVNISYGMSNGIGLAYDIYYTETLQDSALYWYGGKGKAYIDFATDEIPMPYMVIDVSCLTPGGITTWTVNTTINLFVKK